MIKIERFECNMFQENCYVVSDETGECVIVDCGALYEEERTAVVDYIRKNKLKPRHLLCTHGHLDHNFGDTTILENFGLKPEVSQKDEPLLKNLQAQAQALLGMNFGEKAPEAGNFIDEDSVIEFGSHKFSVVSTPGHSPGSVMFYCKEEKVVFSGDTLFKMSIGRTDFMMGSYSDIIESLHRIAELLPADTVVLPGHGEQTTIGFEEKHNPYMK